MNFRSLILCLLLFPIIGLEAQFEVQSLSMSEGLHEAILFNVDAVDDRRVERLWTDFVKEYHGDTKRNRREDEYMTQDATIVDLAGTVPVDIFFKAEEFGDYTRVAVWFRTNESFINFSENPALEQSGQAFLDKFRLEIRKYRVKEQLKEEEKQLNNLKRELGKLERLKEHYEDKIEDAKKAIAKNEENIKQNAVEQEAVKQNIEQQKSVVEKVQEMLNELKLEEE